MASRCASWRAVRGEGRTAIHGEEPGAGRAGRRLAAIVPPERRPPSTTPRPAAGLDRPRGRARTQDAGRVLGSGAGGTWRAARVGRTLRSVVVVVCAGFCVRGWRCLLCAACGRARGRRMRAAGHRRAAWRRSRSRSSEPPRAWRERGSSRPVTIRAGPAPTPTTAVGTCCASPARGNGQGEPSAAIVWYRAHLIMPPAARPGVAGSKTCTSASRWARSTAPTKSTRAARSWAAWRRCGRPPRLEYDRPSHLRRAPSRHRPDGELVCWRCASWRAVQGARRRGPVEGPFQVGDLAGLVRAPGGPRWRSSRCAGCSYWSGSTTCTCAACARSGLPVVRRAGRHDRALHLPAHAVESTSWAMRSCSTRSSSTCCSSPGGRHGAVSSGHCSGARCRACCARYQAAALLLAVGVVATPELALSLWLLPWAQAAFGVVAVAALCWSCAPRGRASRRPAP